MILDWSACTGRVCRDFCNIAKKPYAFNCAILGLQPDYRVNFISTGTHYAWVRAFGPNRGGEFGSPGGLDGQEAPSAARQGVPAGDSYSWVGGNKTIDMPTTGVHTVDRWMRESGRVVDKIVFTTDPAFDPSSCDAYFNGNGIVDPGDYLVIKVITARPAVNITVVGGGVRPGCSR